jgi:DNA-binding response OmpR family regulator
MPEMDGYEVCTRLKADLETREIPVIFLTGQTEVEDETKGFEVGAVDYIHKPFSPAVVKARVQTHLVLRGITQPVSSRPTGGWPETGMWEITPEKHPDWHHHLDVKRPTLSCDLRRVVRPQSAVCRLLAQVSLTTSLTGSGQSSGRRTR